MLLQNKKVAVIGGGIGGMLLARLLQMKNIKVNVYERDLNQEVRVQGSPLDLHEDSGLKAMQSADLLNEFYANHRPNASKARIVDQDLNIRFDEHTIQKTILEEDSESNYNSLDAISKPRPEIDRNALRNILVHSLEPETIVWNSHFESLEKRKEGWNIHFKNGTQVYVDLVIGADGANSKVRPYLSSIKPIYSGITMLEGTIYNAKTNAPKLFEFSKGGKVLAFGDQQTLMYGTKSDGALLFLASSKIPENWIRENDLDFKDNKGIYNWFQTVFKDWSTEWHELFTSEELYFIPRPQYYFPFDQSWETQENLTLIGDAAHRMPPFAGKGANLALLDALELAENLTSNTFSNTKTAIVEFEKQMLKRASEATKETLVNAEQLFSVDALEKLVTIFSKNNKT